MLGKRDGQTDNAGGLGEGMKLEPNWGADKRDTTSAYYQFCKELTALMNLSNSGLPSNENTLTCILPVLPGWRGRDEIRIRELGIAHKSDSCLKILHCPWG